MDAPAPTIGITADSDADRDRFQVGRSYVRAIARAGGVPLILPCRVEDAECHLALVDGIVLTGGDDPDMAAWGVETHPAAKIIDPDRQAFECRLLELLDDDERPVFGVCLGMQLMALHAGGTLDQYLPDTLTTAPDHWGRVPHEVTTPFGNATVESHHRQAITSAGRLEVVGRAHDGVIEAIADPARPFYLGVQWHPERTTDASLGMGLFDRFVSAARERRSDVVGSR